MTRFTDVADRRQCVLLPPSIDDYVGPNNAVRVVEAFIEALDLADLGFTGVVPEATKRPAYHPATLLKIYLYNYLNRIPSSRRLERETQRNLEMIWLTGGLQPDFKTMADFRRDNGVATQATCRQFVLLCREIGLLNTAVVAIDGSEFTAVNSRGNNCSPGVAQHRIEQVETSIARYLTALDTADRHDRTGCRATSTACGSGWFICVSACGTRIA